MRVLHLLWDDAQGSHDRLGGGNPNAHGAQCWTGPAADGQRLACITCIAVNSSLVVLTNGRRRLHLDQGS